MATTYWKKGSTYLKKSGGGLWLCEAKPCDICPCAGVSQCPPGYALTYAFDHDGFLGTFNLTPTGPAGRAVACFYTDTGDYDTSLYRLGRFFIGGGACFWQLGTGIFVTGTRAVETSLPPGTYDMSDATTIIVT